MVPLLVAAFGLPAPAGLAEFAEVWYREVLEGDVAGAAALYEEIYQTASFRGAPHAERRRAAFRAGLCYERLGELQRARNAYAWLAKEGTADLGDASLMEEDRLRVEAALGQLRLDSPAAGGEAEARPAPAVTGAVEDLVRTFEADSRRLADRGHEMRLSVERGQLFFHEARAAAERLRGAGCALVFTVDPPSGRALEESLPGGLKAGEATPEERSAGPRTGDEGDAGEGENARLRGALADRFFRRAVALLVAGDRPAAARDIEKCAALSSAPRPAKWLVRVPPGAGAGVESRAAESARRGLIDERLLQVAAAQAELRGQLETAQENATERGRPQLAVAGLRRALEAVSWLPPDVRDQGEVRSLADRAVRLLLLLGQGAIGEERLASLRDAHQRAVTQLILAAEDAVDGASEEFHLRSGRVVSGPWDLVDRVRSEVRWLLLEARRRLDAGDPEGARRSLRALLGVLDWVPGCDRRGEYREEAASLLHVLGEGAERSAERSPRSG